MLVDDVGDVTITNDGATILKMLDVEVWRRLVPKLPTPFPIRFRRVNYVGERLCADFLQSLTTLWNYLDHLVRPTASGC